MGEFLDLRSGAALLGEAAQLELALFRLFGASSTTVALPALAVTCSVISRRHGELAEAFEARLPVSASIPTEPFRTVATPLGRAIVAACEHAPDGDAFAAFAATVLLPLVVERHEDHAARTTPVADGPGRAVLDRALTVAEEDLDAMAAVAAVLRSRP